MPRKTIKPKSSPSKSVDKIKENNHMSFDDLIKRINKNVKGASVDILSKSEIADISN
jgi:hypothetical protein